MEGGVDRRISYLWNSAVRVEVRLYMYKKALLERRTLKPKTAPSLVTHTITLTIMICNPDGASSFRMVPWFLVPFWEIWYVTAHSVNKDKTDAINFHAVHGHGCASLLQKKSRRSQSMQWLLLERQGLCLVWPSSHNPNQGFPEAYTMN